MPRTRRSAKERAEASVRGLVQKLAKRRAQVAELEAELAEVRALLGAAAGTPVAPPVKRELPPVAVIAETPIPQGESAELAGADNMGPGRWV